MVQVYHRQASASDECRCPRCQRHAELRSQTRQCTAQRAALPSRSRAGAVQAVLNGSPISAAQGTTVHERLLHPHLGHCSSAAPAVCWLPSAACAATLLFDVQSSGLFCGRPGGRELITRLSSRSDTSCEQFSLWPENFSLLILLSYTAHQGLCDYALYKSAIDIDIDTAFIDWWFGWIRWTAYEHYVMWQNLPEST